MAQLDLWRSSHRRPLPILLDSFACGATVGFVSGRSSAGAFGAGVLILSGLLSGLFKPRLSTETQGITWYPVALAPTAVALSLALVGGLSNVTHRQAFVAVVCTCVFLTGIHALLWLPISMGRRRGRGLARTLVIGPTERTEQIRHRLRTFPEAGLVYDSSYVPTQAAQSNDPQAGRLLVEDLLDRHRVTHVLCSVDTTTEAIIRDLVRFAEQRVSCGLVIPVPGVLGNQTRGRLGDLPVIPIRCSPSPGSALAKKIFDFLGASIAILVLSPVLLLTALAIRISDRGPALFCQSRVGRDGRNFKIYKFRSMVVDAERRRVDLLEGNVNPDGLLFKLERDPRITPLGAIIRRLSIDELPQLINVLRGDMSLVGPRPLPVDPEEFDVAAQIRHQVAPGITGMWQVHGANALPYADMLDLDLTYVATRSLGLDLWIMAKTIPALFIRKTPAY